jgi:hypothetical protein
MMGARTPRPSNCCLAASGFISHPPCLGLMNNKQIWYSHFCISLVAFARPLSAMVPRTPKSTKEVERNNKAEFRASTEREREHARLYLEPTNALSPEPRRQISHPVVSSWYIPNIDTSNANEVDYTLPRQASQGLPMGDGPESAESMYIYEHNTWEEPYDRATAVRIVSPPPPNQWQQPPAKGNSYPCTVCTKQFPMPSKLKLATQPCVKNLRSQEAGDIC